VFLRALAPAGPASRVAVSACARHYLLKAGIAVPRPGSHTLRHTCVQRLVDAGFGFKKIGDFIGHRSPASTAIYANSRELHQTGEKPQVAMSGRYSSGLSRLLSMAS
jgi:site-specific recombinase XerD